TVYAMLLLLLYHILVVLLSAGMMLAQCGKKKKATSAQPAGAVGAKSQKSQKGANTPVNADDGLKTATDFTGGEAPAAAADADHRSGRISIHGEVHNTDDYVSAEPVEGDVKAPS
ncbi:hypothetical protein PFISCL1PPCAC_9464, partial [Pristionchus fissidentatus]